MKSRGKEAVSDERDKAIDRLRTFAQTVSGKRTKKDLSVGKRNGEQLLKRERHQRLPSETVKPRSGEQLASKIYLVKYKFRTFKVVGMHKK